MVKSRVKSYRKCEDNDMGVNSPKWFLLLLCPRHHFSKHIHFIHPFHHAAHLFKLFHKCIYLADVFSGPFGNSFFPAAV